MKVGSSKVASLFQPFWSMPDKPTEAKVVLSKVIHHLHLLQALGPALPAQGGPAAVEDVEELGDVEVVVVGLKVAQQLCSACLADSTGRAMGWTRVGRRRRILRGWFGRKLPA